MPNKLLPTSGAVAPISPPAPQPSRLMAVPQGYTSPDVIDRRKGQPQTFGDKLRDLAIKVQTDYRDTYPLPPSPFGPTMGDVAQQPLLPVKTSGKIGAR